MGREIANAGNGLDGRRRRPRNPQQRLAIETPFRCSLPTAARRRLSDTVVVYYSNAIHVTSPVLFTANAITPARLYRAEPQRFQGERLRDCQRPRRQLLAHTGDGISPSGEAEPILP